MTNSKRYRLSTVFLVLLCAGAVLAAQSSPTVAKQFGHGEWWDGEQFKPITFYSVDGVLTSEKPQGPLEVVDLQGRYVVPAFGDTHSHFPDSEKTLDWANSAFLASGVFYVLNPNDIGELSNPIRGQLGKPNSIDVIFAHGGFTCPGGHPKPLYEGLVDQKIYSYAKPDLEGRAYYVIDTRDDIARKWPEFLATKPDFVKLYLLHSENYGPNGANRKSDGLRPEFVSDLTRRAHIAGLRAGAHIESATDFHNAIVGGVDMIMHLPGYHWRVGDSAADYLISDEDARLAKQNNVIVVTTIGLGDYGTEPALLPSLRAAQAENLRRLKTAGVVIVVGTDGRPGGTPAELDHLKATGVFNNRELLNMWSETTPEAIFPNRKIGQLHSGYEANFVVLAKNPLDDIAATKQIVMKVKSGQVMK